VSVLKVTGTELLISSIADSIAARVQSRMRDASRRSADGLSYQLASRFERKLGPRARPGTRRNVRRGRY